MTTMTGAIRLRFVTTNEFGSEVIRYAEDYQFSHVEADMGDGHYLGAYHSGVEERPYTYDKGVWTKQAFWTFPCSDVVELAWKAALRSHLGEPYDWAAIFGFAVRADLEDRKHIICSGLQSLALVLPGVKVLASLPVRPEQMSPRDLAIAVSALLPLGPAQSAV